MFAKTVGFAFSLALPFLLVRVFDPAQVGVYRQVFLVISTLSVILPFSFPTAAFYFLPRETPEKRGAVILHILIFNFVLGGSACLALNIFPQILGWIFRDSSQELIFYAPKIGLVVWLWLFSSFLETVAVANREPRLATVFIVLAQFTKACLLFGAALIFQTIDALLYATLAQTALQTLILLYYLRSRFPDFSRKFSAKLFKEQLLYTLPYGAAGLLWTLQTDLHNYFVGYRFSKEEVAIYTTGCFSMPLVGLLLESVGSVMIPRMSELESRDERREMIELFARAARKLALVFFPLYAFLFVVAEKFITTLFTDKYLAAVPIFMLNLTLLPFDALPLDGVARARPDIGRFLVRVRIFIILGLISALYFGINNFDLRGMIGIVVVVSLFERFLTLWKSAKALNAKKSDILLLKPLLKIGLASFGAGLATALVYWLTRDVSFLCAVGVCGGFFGRTENFIGGALILTLCGLVFVIIYAVLLKLLNVLADGEKVLIAAQFNRLTRFFGRRRAGEFSV